MEFKSKHELIDWIYTMQLQNTNGRESHNEMFKKGIEAAINELKQLKLFDLHSVSWSVCCSAELIRFNTYVYNECLECGKTYPQTEQLTAACMV